MNYNQFKHYLQCTLKQDVTYTAYGQNKSCDYSKLGKINFKKSSPICWKSL